MDESAAAASLVMTIASVVRPYAPEELPAIEPWLENGAPHMGFGKQPIVGTAIAALLAPVVGRFVLELATDFLSKFRDEAMSKAAKSALDWMIKKFGLTAPPSRADAVARVRVTLARRTDLSAEEITALSEQIWSDIQGAGKKAGQELLSASRTQ